MFISGLPLHVLLVHAVVILVPLSALGALVIAIWPAARRGRRSDTGVGDRHVVPKCGTHSPTHPDMQRPSRDRGCSRRRSCSHCAAYPDVLRGIRINMVAIDRRANEAVCGIVKSDLECPEPYDV